MEELELYAYSTEKYLLEGLVKVGHCQIGRHKERIREQFGTSNPEQPVFILLGNLPKGIRDHHVHAQLIKNGCSKVENGPGKEWFVITDKSDPFRDVRRAYNELVKGSSRTECYRLRNEQSDAIEKASKWFKREYPPEVIGAATHANRFLINAKMRFGKCFTSIHLAKKLNARNTLIVTYKPEVISEWVNVINNHKDFDGWIGFRAKRNDGNINDPYLPDTGIIPKSKGPMVVCVSLQDLAIEADGSTKKRLKEVSKTKWDLIIFDEVHFGSRTERAKYIIDSLDWKKRLDLSGTPFRLIQEDDFCAEQVYTYSYLDEQENKRAEISSDPKNKKDFIYRVMPDLEVSTIEITDEDIQDQKEKFFTDDLDFSLNELFRVSGGKFVHSDAVDHLWREVKAMIRYMETEHLKWICEVCEIHPDRIVNFMYKRITDNLPPIIDLRFSLRNQPRTQPKEHEGNV